MWLLEIISIHKEQIWASGCFGIIPITISNIYLYNYLKLIEPSIRKYKKGAQQESMDVNILSKDIFRIPILQKKQKQKSLKYYKGFDTLSEMYDKHIEQLNEDLKTAFMEELIDKNNYTPLDFNNL